MIFKDVVNSTGKSILSLSDIERIRIEQWNRRIILAGLHRDIQMFSSRASPLEVKERLNSILSLVQVIYSKIEILHAKIQPNHFFVVTDTTGVALKVIAKEDMIQKLESLNVGLGTNFAIECSGINAISVALEMENCVIVRGNEHTISIFQYASCISAPIKVNNKTCAYIALAIPIRIDPTFAVSIVQYIAVLIEKKIIQHDLNPETQFENRRLESYELSERQKEIAYQWARGLSYSQIAELLCISTHTVRTVLRTVYVKTDVHSKAEFIRKFSIF